MVFMIEEIRSFHTYSKVKIKYHVFVYKRFFHLSCMFESIARFIGVLRLPANSYYKSTFKPCKF